MITVILIGIDTYSSTAVVSLLFSSLLVSALLPFRVNVTPSRKETKTIIGQNGFGFSYSYHFLSVVWLKVQVVNFDNTCLQAQYVLFHPLMHVSMEFSGIYSLCDKRCVGLPIFFFYGYISFDIL